MRVLVTGGAGFIGSHVVDRLVAAGHRARILDLVPSPYHDGNVEQIVGDLRDPETVRRAVAGCDVVMHLAAVADVDQVAKDPATADVVNVRCTQTLLECVREQGIERFVFASTIWVYGDASDPTPLEETAPLGLPKHFYTATKLAGEMYTASYGALYGLEWTILRFGIPYGPRGRPTAVVPAFTKKALAGQPLTIAGDGTQVASLRLRRGSGRGLRRGARPDRSEPCLQPRRRRDDERAGDRAHDPRHRRRWCRSSTSRAGSATCTAATCPASAPARELGWRATTSFADGVRRYVDWVTAEQGTPSAAIAASTDGSAATVCPPRSRRSVGVRVVQEHDVARPKPAGDAARDRGAGRAPLPVTSPGRPEDGPPTERADDVERAGAEDAVRRPVERRLTPRRVRDHRTRA